MDLKKDILLNYISLVVMAISGFAINALIIYFFDSSALGIFNETYAWYMVISQIAVWGVHMSVVKYIPEKKGDGDKFLFSAILIAIIASFTTMVLCAVFMHYSNLEWNKSLSNAILGLLFYSINKVLLNYLNALHKMTTYAVLQIIRYVVLFLGVFLFSTSGCIDNVAYTFPLTEGIVLCISLFAIRKHIEKGLRFFDLIDLDICKQVFSFGTRILPSNMVLELNSKVDVVCLGFFIDDASKIGVYSFAILFTDGMYQLLSILRKIINPNLSERYVNGNLNQYLYNLYNGIKTKMIALAYFVYMIVIVCFYMICKIFIGDEFVIGTVFIAIIGISIVITKKHIILGDLLAQTGFPADESIINIITIICNFVFNILLIYIMGIVGAAIATALSYVCFALLLDYLSRRKLSINIGL